jgi:hypothetical protein
VLSVYAEIVVLHHLLSDAPMRREENLVSKNIKEKKFPSTSPSIIKHVLEANINFPNFKEKYK